MVIFSYLRTYAVDNDRALVFADLRNQMRSIMAAVLKRFAEFLLAFILLLRIYFRYYDAKSGRLRAEMRMLSLHL